MGGESLGDVLKKIRDVWNTEFSGFSQEDLYIEWEATELRAPQQSQIQQRSLNAEALEAKDDPFVSDLDILTRKFSYGRTPITKWQRLYKFAESEKPVETRDVDKPDPGSAGLGHVNGSSDDIDKWVKGILTQFIDLNDAVNPFLVLLGEVGSGKTTFNKYVSTMYFEYFRDSNIIISRIEYSKLRDYITSYQKGEESIRDVAERYITACLIRDFFTQQLLDLNEGIDANDTFTPRNEFFDVSKNPTTSVSNNDSYFAFCQREYDGFCTEDQQRAKKLLRRAQEAFSNPGSINRNRWFDALRIHADQINLLAPLLLWLERKKSQNFFVIIDGLDLLDPSDFIGGTENRKIVFALSDWLIKEKQCVKIPNVGELIWPKFQVTSRNATWSILREQFNAALSHNKALEYSIRPAHFGSIAASLDDLLLEQGNLENITRSRFFDFDRLEIALARRLRVPKSEITSIFQKNLRHRLNFLRNVIEECLQNYRARDLNEHPHVANFFLKNFDELCHTKSYRLVEMLLHARNDVFENFVQFKDRVIVQDLAISDVDLDQLFQNNDAHSGYIGNIFAHHIPYSSYDEIDFILEKLRLLDSLAGQAEKVGRVKSEIEKSFEKNGWRRSKLFDASLAMCIREGFIQTSFAPSRGLVYEISPLGKLTLNRLIYNLSYLENVFFGCLLPRGIARNIETYRRGDVRPEEWSATSLYHVYLLFMLLEAAEKRALKRFIPKMRASVGKQMQAIIEADSASQQHAASTGDTASIERSCNKKIEAFWRQFE
ncbi:MAG: hypothetical protein ABJP70_05945 [Erythrobacter sp.]